MKLRLRCERSPVRVPARLVLLVAWLTWACCLLFCNVALAQQTTPPPDPNATTGQEKKAGEEKKKDSGRIFGIIPAFHVTSAAQSQPLTSNEKFRLALKRTIDPMSFVGAGINATLYQTVSDNPGYGEGASRFAKRFGASMADKAIGSMLGTYVFPSLLHQDPRYFRKGEGSAKGRIGYAVSRVVITRTDAGKPAFNWSKALSSVGTSAISNFYAPAEDRDVGRVFRRAGWSYVYSAGFNVLSEFWPDIACKVFHRCQHAAGAVCTRPAPATN